MRHLIPSFYVEPSVSISPHLHSSPGPLHHIPSPLRLYSTMPLLLRFIPWQLDFPTRPLLHGGCSLTTHYRILVPSAIVSMVVSTVVPNNASSSVLSLRQLSSTMHHIPQAVVSNNASSHCSAAVVLNNALSYPSSQGGCSPTMHCHIRSAILFNASLYPCSLSASFPWWLFFNNVLSPPVSLGDCPPNNVSSPRFDPMAVVFTNASFYPTPRRLFRCLAYL